MNRLLSGITAFTLLVAGSASAQSSLPLDYRSSSSLGFFITGYADLSFGIFQAGGNKSLLMTELDLGFRPPDGGFGYALGIDAFALRDPGADMNKIAFYPAVTYGTDFGTFSAGIPRSVLDRGYLARPNLAASRFYDLEFYQLSGSTLAYTYLFTKNNPYGLRYDVSFGATSFGASYHRINSGGGTNVVALAIRHDFAAISSPYRFAAFAGLENARSGGGFNKTNYMIGVEGGSDQVNAGLSYRRDAFLGNIQVVTLFGEYRINDFTFSAAVMNFNPGPPTQFGIGAEYRFNDNAYANISMLDNSSPGFNPIYEFSVGWRF